ncbi:hypothetical protein GX420_05170 [bacterium]|nr:hypothetical protein [bacterium]
MIDFNNFKIENIENILKISKDFLIQQIQNICELNSNLINEIYSTLEFIDEILPRLLLIEGFSIKNLKDKIIGIKNYEYFFDYITELRVAKILIDKNVEFTFNPEVINYNNEKKRADILINLKDKKIYIEVKRIRETNEFLELEKFCKKIENEISCFPSPYFILINFSFGLLEALEKKIELDKEIVEHIKNFISNCNVIEDYEYSLENIFYDLGFFLIYKKKNELKDKKETICQIFMKPIPFTGDENKKFWVDIEKKRGQLSKNDYNFIFFWSDSTTHDEVSLINYAIFFYRESRVHKIETNIDKLFKDITNLHGIILRTKYIPTEEINKYKIFLNPYTKIKMDNELFENFKKILNLIELKY